MTEPASLAKYPENYHRNFVVIIAAPEGLTYSQKLVRICQSGEPAIIEPCDGRASRPKEYRPRRAFDQPVQPLLN